MAPATFRFDRPGFKVTLIDWDGVEKDFYCNTIEEAVEYILKSTVGQNSLTEGWAHVKLSKTEVADGR